MGGAEGRARVRATDESVAGGRAEISLQEGPKHLRLSVAQVVPAPLKQRGLLPPTPPPTPHLPRAFTLA